MSQHDDAKLEKTYIVKFTGTWQADKYNRLIFKVKKEKSRHDILTFNNKWIINKHHRICYKYEKAELITKKKETHEFTLKGYWNITGDSRLYYEIDQDNHSGIEFKIGAAFFEKRNIKYKLMVGRNFQEDSITFQGHMKLSQ